MIILLILILYAVACYAFLFINSGLKLLNRKLAKKEPAWTFKDAVRSWGFGEEEYVVTDRKSYLYCESFSWSFFTFIFIVSPFLFFCYVFLILLRIIISPILYFIGEK